MFRRRRKRRKRKPESPIRQRPKIKYEGSREVDAKPVVVKTSGYQEEMLSPKQAVVQISDNQDPVQQQVSKGFLILICTNVWYMHYRQVIITVLLFLMLHDEKLSKTT